MRRVHVVPLLAALVIAAAAPAAVRPAAAEGSRAVKTWVEVGSTAPASGCALGVSVEIRASSTGYAVGGVDVMVALAADGEVLTADRSRTNENGVAYLTLDTGYAPVGTDGFLDVVIAGEWVTGRDLAVTANGPCDGDPALLSDTAKIWMPDPAPAEEDLTAGATGEVGRTSVDVPTYYQQRNLSCEYASLVIAMGAFGTWVSEYEFDARVGWSPNPHWGFRGDINGYWGNTGDYGVYAEALAPALADFGFDGEVFYGNGDPAALTARLDAGAPTLVWLGFWGDTGETEYTDDGTAFELYAGLHVVVAYGYDAWGVYVSDPATGSLTGYDWGTFMWVWNVLGGMSLAVSPA